MIKRFCRWVLRNERMPSVGFGVDVKMVYLDDDDRPRVHWRASLTEDGEFVAEYDAEDLGQAFKEAYLLATHVTVAA